MTVWDFIYNSIIWNSSAFFTKVTDELKKKQPDKFARFEVGDWATEGNVTEQAILNFFLSASNNDGQKLIDHKKSAGTITENIVAFTSKRKKASIVIKTSTGFRVYTKGAPDMLFPEVRSIVTSDGSIVGIDEEQNIDASLLQKGETSATGTGDDILNRTVTLFAKQALRTILMCYIDLSEDEYATLKRNNGDFEKEESREVLERGFTAVGIWGIQDPLRDQIKDAIKQCLNAGIKVIMCTGDNLDTAIAISKNAGIVSEEAAEGPNKKYTCTTGKEFRHEVGDEL